MIQPLKIRELRVRAVRVPMAEPHRTASGVITESPLVLTDVVTDQDIIGHSYVFCYSALALKPTALLVKGLEPLIAGHPLAPLEIEQLLARRFRLLGPQGLTGIAMAAIDMALWDALARAQGLPLARLTWRHAQAHTGLRCDRLRRRDGSARVAAQWAERGIQRRQGEDRLPRHARRLSGSARDAPSGRRRSVVDGRL